MINIPGFRSESMLFGNWLAAVRKCKILQKQPIMQRQTTAVANKIMLCLWHCGIKCTVVTKFSQSYC